MPSHGALGVTLACTRVVQILCLIPIIGLIANFVSQIVSSNQNVPQVLLGTLSVACVAILYAVVTFILYLDSMLPFLLATAIDGLLLIAFIVIAVVIGQPLTYLNCLAIGSPSASENMYDFTSALATNSNQSGTTFNLNAWIASSQGSCFEMKSVWGLSISLCILFSISAVSVIGLWKRKPFVPLKGSEV